MASASDFQRLHNAISTNLNKISTNGLLLIDFLRLSFIDFVFSFGSRTTRPKIRYSRRQWTITWSIVINWKNKEINFISLRYLVIVFKMKRKVSCNRQTMHFKNSIILEFSLKLIKFVVDWILIEKTIFDFFSDERKL